MKIHHLKGINNGQMRIFGPIDLGGMKNNRQFQVNLSMINTLD